MTEINEQNLLLRGYREFTSAFPNREKRFFQKRVDDEHGRKYFIDFREWEFSHTTQGTITSFDAQIHTHTDTGGYLWITMQEDSIEQIEDRAEALWKAGGSVYYEESRHRPIVPQGQKRPATGADDGKDIGEPRSRERRQNL